MRGGVTFARGALRTAVAPHFSPQVEQNLASGESREPLRGACRQRLGQPPDVSHLGDEKPEGEIRSYSPVHMRPTQIVAAHQYCDA